MLFSALITCSVMATLLYTVRSLIQPRESISAKTALKYQTEKSDLKLKPAEKRSSLSLRVSAEDNKRWNVIILTHMSSGSTLTGNLFNLHPDVFIFMNPFITCEERFTRTSGILSMTKQIERTPKIFLIYFVTV